MGLLSSSIAVKSLLFKFKIKCSTNIFAEDDSHVIQMMFVLLPTYIDILYVHVYMC